MRTVLQTAWISSSRVSLQAARLLVLVLTVGLLSAASVGCGAPPIERLHGEPKAADRYTVPRPVDPPVAEAVNRFISAVRRGAVEEANESLSRATRMALEVRARTIGLRGVDLLRKPGPQVKAAVRKMFIADPLATFTLRNLKTIRVGERPWPVNRPHDGRTLLWAVELIDQAGHSRIITLRFEQIAWRIHNPRLRSK